MTLIRMGRMKLIYIHRPAAATMRTCKHGRSLEWPAIQVTKTDIKSYIYDWFNQYISTTSLFFSLAFILLFLLLMFDDDDQMMLFLVAQLRLIMVIKRCLETNEQTNMRLASINNELVWEYPRLDEKKRRMMMMMKKKKGKEKKWEE